MYTSKIVGVGNYNNNPFVFYNLSSRSKPFRELRLDKEKGKVNVFPRKGYESHPTNTDPETDNYSCIKTGRLNDARFITAFNGHMAKRTNQNLLDGMSPLVALDLTLLEFRGQVGDARLGAVAYSANEKPTSYWLGINDISRREKRVLGYPNNRYPNLENKAVFVYNQDTELEKSLLLPNGNLSAEELAEYIHKNILNSSLIFNLSTAVGIIRPNCFELGVYNPKISVQDLEIWALNYTEGKKHLLVA